MKLQFVYNAITLDIPKIKNRFNEYCFKIVLKYNYFFVEKGNSKKIIEIAFLKCYTIFAKR